MHLPYFRVDFFSCGISDFPIFCAASRGADRSISTSLGQPAGGQGTTPGKHPAGCRAQALRDRVEVARNPRPFAAVQRQPGGLALKRLINGSRRRRAGRSRLSCRRRGQAARRVRRGGEAAVHGVADPAGNAPPTGNPDYGRFGRIPVAKVNRRAPPRGPARWHGGFQGRRTPPGLHAQDYSGPGPPPVRRRDHGTPRIAS